MTQPDRNASDNAEAAAQGGHANRRKSFRVAAPLLSLRAWRMEAHERLIDRPLPSRRISLTAVDLGRGGAGALFSTGNSAMQIAPPVKLGDRIRLEIPSENGDDFLLLEGRVTYLRAVEESEELRVGIEFQAGLSESIARRTANGLDKILARLQREEIRKVRGNMAA